MGLLNIIQLTNAKKKKVQEYTKNVPLLGTGRRTLAILPLGL